MTTVVGPPGSDAAVRRLSMKALRTSVLRHRGEQFFELVHDDEHTTCSFLLAIRARIGRGLAGHQQAISTQQRPSCTIESAAVAPQLIGQLVATFRVAPEAGSQRLQRVGGGGDHVHVLASEPSGRKVAIRQSFTTREGGEEAGADHG
jgi:hypothetical protein